VNLGFVKARKTLTAPFPPTERSMANNRDNVSSETDAEMLRAAMLWAAGDAPDGETQPISDEVVSKLIQWWILDAPLRPPTSPPGPPTTPPQQIPRLDWDLTLIEGQTFYPFPSAIAQAVPVDARFEVDPTFPLPSEARVTMQGNQHGLSVQPRPELDGWHTLLDVVDTLLDRVVARIFVTLSAPLSPQPGDNFGPPRILTVDAPATIPGDGQPRPVSLRFEDPDGDVAQLRFETLVGPSEDEPPQTFNLNVRGQTRGELNFGLFCANPGDDTFTVINRLTLIDERGLSDSVEVEYRCLPL